MPLPKNILICLLLIPISSGAAPRPKSLRSEAVRQSFATLSAWESHCMNANRCPSYKEVHKHIIDLQRKIANSGIRFRWDQIEGLKDAQSQSIPPIKWIHLSRRIKKTILKDLNSQTVIPAKPPDLQAGERLFRTHCQSCHGDGYEPGPLARATRLTNTSLVNAWVSQGASPLDLMTVIREGRKQQGMPGFARTLKTTEIWDLAFYSQRLSFQQAPRTALSKDLSSQLSLGILTNRSSSELESWLKAKSFSERIIKGQLAYMRVDLPYEKTLARLLKSDVR